MSISYPSFTAHPAPGPRTPLRRSLLIAGLGLCLLTTACLGPRPVRETVYDRAGIVVKLTSMKSEGAIVERDFAHPARFEAEDIERLISPIEVELRTKKDPRRRTRAIAPELVADVADALATSFALAGPNQTLSVQAIQRKAKLVVLNEKRLTSFIASYDGAALRLLFSRVDWRIPKSKENQPLPNPSEVEKQAEFRVLPYEGAQLAGTQGISLPWSLDGLAASVEHPAGGAEAAVD